MRFCSITTVEASDDLRVFCFTKLPVVLLLVAFLSGGIHFF